MYELANSAPRSREVDLDARTGREPSAEYLSNDNESQTRVDVVGACCDDRFVRSGILDRDRRRSSSNAWIGLPRGTTANAIAIALLTGLLLSALILAIAAICPFEDNLMKVGFLAALTMAVAMIAIDMSQLLVALLRWGTQALTPNTAKNSSTQASASPVPIVVPLLVRSRKDIDAAIQCIEENWGLETDMPASIILLVDFCDADAPVIQSDGSLREELNARLKRCNRKRADNRRPAAIALYRARKWNPFESLWMGWERKRGKIVEFLRLTRGYETSFVDGCPVSWNDAPFVFVMDIDSRISADDVARLSKMLTELRAKGPADELPAVLSPYVDTLDLPNEPFERWLSQPTVFRGGVDWKEPRLRQILLGADIYNGKAMLHVDDFLAQTAHILENTVLSHDHLEAILGRGCSTADVSLFEPFPKSREDWERRQHRWIRGDTQILPWIFTVRRSDRGAHLTITQRLACAHVVLNSLSPLIGYLTICWSFLAGAQFGFAILIFVALAQREGIVLNALQIPRFSRGQTINRGLGRASAYLVTNGLLKTLGIIIFLQRNALLTFDATRVAIMRMLRGRQGLLEWYPDDPEKVIRMRRQLEAAALGAAVALSLVVSGTLPLAGQIFIWIVVPAALAQLRKVSRPAQSLHGPHRNPRPNSGSIRQDRPVLPRSSTPGKTTGSQRRRSPASSAGAAVPTAAE